MTENSFKKFVLEAFERCFSALHEPERFVIDDHTLIFCLNSDSDSDMKFWQAMSLVPDDWSVIRVNDFYCWLVDSHERVGTKAPCGQMRLYLEKMTDDYWRLCGSWHPLYKEMRNQFFVLTEWYEKPKAFIEFFKRQ